MRCGALKLGRCEAKIRMEVAGISLQDKISNTFHFLGSPDSDRQRDEKRFGERKLNKETPGVWPETEASES